MKLKDLLESDEISREEMKSFILSEISSSGTWEDELDELGIELEEDESSEDYKNIIEDWIDNNMSDSEVVKYYKMFL